MFFFVQAEDGIRYLVRSRGLGDVYKRQAQYYVYAKGEFSRESPELQMRYFVNALQPPEDAPARKFEFQPDSLTYFRLLWSNHKYALYKMLTLSLIHI